MNRGWYAILAVMALAGVGLVLSVRPAGAQPAAVSSRQLLVKPEGLPALNLYMEEVGRGRPLVLLHGLGGSGYAWRQVVPALAKSYRVITLDLMGFGRSDKPMHDRYAPADHAQVVLAALRALDVRGAALVGHSLGGLVALLATIEANRGDAGRISHVLLFNAPALPQPSTEAVEFMKLPVVPYVVLSLMPAEQTARLGLLGGGARRMDHISDTDISFYADPLRSVGGAHAIIQSARQIAPADPRPILKAYKTIRQPVLAAGCKDDPTVPISTAVALSKYLPRARLAVLEKCQHLPMEQNPRAVVAAVHSFLKR